MTHTYFRIFFLFWWKILLEAHVPHSFKSDVYVITYIQQRINNFEAKGVEYCNNRKRHEGLKEKMAVVLKRYKYSLCDVHAVFLVRCTREQRMGDVITYSQPVTRCEVEWSVPQLKVPGNAKEYSGTYLHRRLSAVIF